MAVTGVSRFERFFREAAGLDVDKNDLKRYSDFVHDEIHDLLIMGEATAKANVRDVIEPEDLPITKGLQETIEAFDKLNEELELTPILDYLVSRPPLRLEYSAELEAELPRIAGALSLALAKTFKIIDPALKNPASTHWEQAFRIFNLLL